MLASLFGSKLLPLRHYTHARSLITNSLRTCTSDALNQTSENEEVGSSRPRIYSQLLLDVPSPE